MRYVHAVPSTLRVYSARFEERGIHRRRHHRRCERASKRASVRFLRPLHNGHARPIIFHRGSDQSHSVTRVSSRLCSPVSLRVPVCVCGCTWKPAYQALQLSPVCCSFDAYGCFGCSRFIPDSALTFCNRVSLYHRGF